MINIQIHSKKYGNKLVLNSINLNFEKGKVYGIVGDNGAGKTTFFNCFCGLEEFEGTIKSTALSLKNKIGYLPTEPYFFDKMTGKEYLQFFCNARRLYGVPIQKRNVFELPLDQYTLNYSTGMKKKLALTAILLLDNECFVLDEPFNGVDFQSNFLITEIIHELRNLKKIVLISSHIFSTLKETCDEIILLKRGSVEQQIKKEKFSELEKELKQTTLKELINNLELK